MILADFAKNIHVIIAWGIAKCDTAIKIIFY